MTYIVYDKTTGAILKTGVAPDTEACNLQIDNTNTQSVVSGETDTELTSNAAPLGLH